jgi:hypothetical protein
VAVLLAFSGAMAIFYAGFLPMPPLSDAPVPLAWQVLGVIEMVAAIGVFRQQAWGRALGVAIVAVSLGLAVLRPASQASGAGAPEILATLALDVAPGVFVLWVLLRRWPSPA